jgi:hypothetical protein
MKRTPIRILQLACVSALALSCAPTSQALAKEELPFKVTVKGTIGETWSRVDEREDGECHMRHELKGGASIRFETPGPQRVKASIDDGWTGNPRLRVTSQRTGTETTVGGERAENGEFFCDNEPRVRGGECGTKTGTAPLGLSFAYRPFRIEASGEGDLWDGNTDCVYPPSPLVYSLYDDTSWDTLALLERAGLRLKQRYGFWVFGGGDAHGHTFKRRRAWSFHNTKRITLPYRESKGGPQLGELTADVEWTITFRHIGKIRQPPRG